MRFFPRFSFMKRIKAPAAILGLIILWMSWLFWQSLIARYDGVWAGFEHLWADAPLHIAIAASFAYKAPWDWLRNHPMYAGAHLTYPFVMDALSGFLMRLGFSVPAAFGMTGIAAIVALIVGVFVLFGRLFRSSAKGLVTVILFLFSSGLGMFRHVFQAPSLAHFFNSILLNPPFAFSRFEEYQWYSGNVVEGILLPQRAFTLGFPVGIWTIWLVLKGLDDPSPSRARRFLLGAGIMAGLLPVIHMHTLIALFFVLAGVFFTSLKNIRRWFWFAIPTVAISVGLYFGLIVDPLAKPQFMRWQPGWVEQTFFHWIAMWGLIFGVTIPLAAWSLGRSWSYMPRRTWAFFCGFIAIFVFANLVLVQPVPWDNSKMFFWAYLGLSALCANWLVDAWCTKKMIMRGLVVVLAFFLGVTGACELIKITVGNSKSMMITDTSTIRFNEFIREHTEPNDVFLTSKAHNHPVMVWAARPIFLGFTPYVANHGFPPETREADLQRMFDDPMAFRQLFCRHHISYVYCGPGERAGEHADCSRFFGVFPMAFSDPSTMVFESRAYCEKPR